MIGIGAGRIAELRQDFEKVLHVLERCVVVDKQLQVPTEEFVRRQRAIWRATPMPSGRARVSSSVWWSRYRAKFIQRKAAFSLVPRP